MAITAKVKVTSKTQTEEGDDGQYNVAFSADYADGRNKEWAKYTPGLSLTLGLKTSVANQFEVGEAYTLTFEKSE